MEIKLSIKKKYAAAFIAFLKTVDYIKIEEVTDTPVTSAQEPLPTYSKKKRPSADEIEQMIIAKAMRDAEAIQRGELETKSFNSIEELIADLESDINDEE